jgi:hypothetical protein
MEKIQGIIKDDRLIAENSLIADGSLENACADTQLNKQSLELETIGFMTWAGSFLLRSIITFFVMEYIKTWWEKFKKIYWPEKEENAITESISQKTEEPKT